MHKEYEIKREKKCTIKSGQLNSDKSQTSTWWPTLYRSLGLTADLALSATPNSTRDNIWLGKDIAELNRFDVCAIVNNKIENFYLYHAQSVHTHWIMTISRKKSIHLSALLMLSIVKPFLNFIFDYFLLVSSCFLIHVIWSRLKGALYCSQLIYTLPHKETGNELVCSVLLGVRLKFTMIKFWIFTLVKDPLSSSVVKIYIYFFKMHKKQTNQACLTEFELFTTAEASHLYFTWAVDCNTLVTLLLRSSSRE